VCGVNRVRGVVGVWTKAVMPLSSERSTLRHLVDSLGDRLDVGVDSTIADEIVAVNILDRLANIH